MAPSDRRAAAERHCDLLRQGCMKAAPVAPHTPAQIEAGKRHAARILAKLDAWESVTGEPFGFIGTEWNDCHGKRRVTGTLEHGGRTFYEVQNGDSSLRDLVPVEDMAREIERDAARIASRDVAQASHVAAAAAKAATPLERFLATLPPLTAGRARKSLGLFTRVDGRNAASRAAHLERMVAEGYRATEAGTIAHPERVGYYTAFTSYGLAYAAWLAREGR